MSVELVALIITAASLLVTLGGGFFAGFVWMLRRMDEQSAQAEASANARFAQAEANINSRFAQAEAGINARFDKVGERFAQAESSVNNRFAQAEAGINARFDKVDHKLDRMDERINGVQTELTEVKIAVARLEGPRQRLILPH